MLQLGSGGENRRMTLQRLLLLAGAVVALMLAYRFYGWHGALAVGTAGVTWLLLQVTRLLQVLRRAAGRPIGQVDSAVMLHAKLKPGMTLLRVLALTGALGERASDKDTQSEVFCWRDAGDARVTCTFVGGKLADHTLLRPAEQAPAPAP